MVARPRISTQMSPRQRVNLYYISYRSIHKIANSNNHKSHPDIQYLSMISRKLVIVRVLANKWYHLVFSKQIEKGETPSSAHPISPPKKDDNAYVEKRAKSTQMRTTKNKNKGKKERLEPPDTKYLQFFLPS
jgi:hypothetical protein